MDKCVDTQLGVAADRSDRGDTHCFGVIGDGGSTMGLLPINRAKPADCPVRGTGEVPPQNSRHVAFALSFALISSSSNAFHKSQSLYLTGTLQRGSACLGFADKGGGRLIHLHMRPIS